MSGTFVISLPVALKDRKPDFEVTARTRAGRTVAREPVALHMPRFAGEEIRAKVELRPECDCLVKRIRLESRARGLIDSWPTSINFSATYGDVISLGITLVGE